MNKYYRLLDRILIDGKTQTGRKGTSRYLLNESLSLTPADMLDIFEGHNIARRKLRDELRLFMNGERSVEKYREAEMRIILTSESVYGKSCRRLSPTSRYRHPKQVPTNEFRSHPFRRLSRTHKLPSC